MLTEKQIWTGFRLTTKRNRNWERNVGFARAQHELYVQTQTTMQQRIAETNQLLLLLFEKLVNNNWELSYIPSVCH